MIIDSIIEWIIDLVQLEIVQIRLLIVSDPTESSLIWAYPENLVEIGLLL